jgi:hypothetical protein
MPMTKTRDLADLGGGFIQAGTGAVQRTVESKLQDVVSVKDFGAVGDGVANDTAAIQAAVSANPGKIIFFPKGTYRTTSSINLYSTTNGHTSLVGEGASIINATSVTDFAFVVTCPNGSVLYAAPSFENLTINCQQGIRLNSLTGGFTDDSSTQYYMWKPVFSKVEINGTSAASSFGIQLSKAFNARIVNCVVSGFSTCVKAKGSDFTFISHSRISQGSTLVDDESASSFGNGTVISHCDMGGVSASGWFVKTNARESTITNNALENFLGSIGGFIDITGGLTHRIYANRIDSSSSTPPAVRCVPSPAFIVVRDNYSVSNQPGGITITSSPAYWYNNIIRRRFIFENNSFVTPKSINAFKLKEDASGYVVTPETEGSFSYSDQGGSAVIEDSAFKFVGSGIFHFDSTGLVTPNGRVYIVAKATGGSSSVTVNGNVIQLTSSYAKYFIGRTGSGDYAITVPAGVTTFIQSVSFEVESGSNALTIPLNFFSGSGTGRSTTVSIPAPVYSTRETPYLKVDTYAYTQGGADDATLNSGSGRANGSDVLSSVSPLMVEEMLS